MKAATAALDALAGCGTKSALMETAATNVRCDLDALLETEQQVKSLRMLKKQKDNVQFRSV